MDLHPHVGFDFHGVRERSRLHRDILKTGDGRRPLRINLFIHPVTVHIRAEVQSLLVELLDRRGDFDRKPDDLIGNELFLQWSTGLGSVVDDADHVAAIKTIRWSVIARVGVVKHRDRHPP